MKTIGIWYRVWGVSGIIIVIAIIILLFSIYDSKKASKKKEQKRKTIKKDLILGIVILAIGLTFSSYYVYKAFFPNVTSCIGQFEYEKRNSRVAPPLPLTTEYLFSFENSDKKQGFYLDVISKKEIFSEDFEKECQYKIWYDEETNIILRIEKTEDGSMPSDDGKQT